MRTSKLIHIVDDSAEIGALLHRLITRMGHTARVLNNGQELEDALLTERPDLIMMDVMLPWATGFDVLRRLNSFGRIGRTRVIMMSCLARERLRPMGRLAELPFLHKPFRIEEVKTLIEQAFATRAAPATDVDAAGMRTKIEPALVRALRETAEI